MAHRVHALTCFCAHARRYKDKQVGYMACSLLLHEVRAIVNCFPQRHVTHVH